MPVTFAKLRDGSWGICSTSSVDVGDVVRVDRRDGSSKLVRIERVLSGSNGRWMCSISDLESSRRVPAARPSAGRSRRSRKARKEGVLDGMRTVRRGEYSPALGIRLWLGRGAEARPVVLVGYQVVDIREDGLSFGYPDDEGTFTDCYYRPATEDEAAEMAAERGMREEEARAQAKKQADALQTAMQAARAPLAGLSRCTHVHPPHTAVAVEVGRYKVDGGQVVVSRHEWDGRTAYVEKAYQFDDYRTYTWAPPELLEELRRELVERSPSLDKAAAVDWLSRYRGCHGTEFFEWLASTEEKAACAS